MSVDPVLLYLQFCRVGLGVLLCFGPEAEMGKPRVYARPHPAALRFRCTCHPDRNDPGEREHRARVYLRDDRSYDPGIYNRSSHGADFPCEVLGLQRAAGKYSRIYLSGGISVLGAFLCADGAVCPCACGECGPQDSADRV